MFNRSLRSHSDEALMRLVADRDQRALTELYNRYASSLLRYFFRMLWKDEAMAQDFLHDLFLKIIRNPGSFDTARKFSTWIFSVANNMCKNEYRRQAMKDRVSAAEPEIFSFGIASSDASLSVDFEAAILYALESLDEEEKNLYALRFEVELPLSEIAEMLQCPVGTIKSRIFNLKKKMAAHLTREVPRKKYGIHERKA